MKKEKSQWDNDDDATQAAEGSTVDEIRAEAARIRALGSSGRSSVVVDVGDAVDHGDDAEPTIIRNFDPIHDVKDASADDVTVHGDDSQELIDGVSRFDPADDPTTAMAQPVADDPTTVMAQPVADDPTTVMAQPVADDRAPDATGPATKKRAPKPLESLIDGKAPPSSEASFWEGGQMAPTDEAPIRSGKGPVPKWFIATSLLAVVMAVGLVFLVLWALSGSSV